MFDTNNNIQRWLIIQKVLTLSIIFLLKAYNYYIEEWLPCS